MEKKVLIKRPVKEVFDYVVDCGNSQDYLGKNFHFEAVTAPPYHVGSKARAVGIYLGISIKLSYVLTEYRPSQLMRLVAPRQAINGIPVTSEVIWRFEERGSNLTLIRFCLEVTPDLTALGRFGGWMGNTVIQKAEGTISNVLDKALNQLKYNLEAVSKAA